jgi:L-tyrosine peroxygenase
VKWTFGGFPYGIEPLVLPTAGAPDAAHDDAAPAADHADACRDLHALADRGVAEPGVEPCAAAEELFWFRWITGHQVCFVVWRLIAQLLDDVNHGRRSPYDAIAPMCRYIDGYSAMLLYTGSCPPDVYGTVIRPSMRLRHRAFSGSWAPDYWPIGKLFRGRPPAAMWSADGGELQDAITLLHMVHDGVAARLVADGRSLLRAASVRGPNHRMAAMMYDSYFATVRGPVPRHEVVSQLLRRLVAIAQDVAANGLYAADDTGERPPELQAAEVVTCEHGLVEIMLEVARCAADLEAAALQPAQPAP